MLLTLRICFFIGIAGLSLNIAYRRCAAVLRCGDQCRRRMDNGGAALAEDSSMEAPADAVPAYSRAAWEASEVSARSPVQDP